MMRIARKTCIRSSFQIRLGSSSIESLRRSFLDPSSPFHIPPGEIGPESPGTGPEVKNALLEPSQTVTYLDPQSAKQARLEATAGGYDPLSFWEQVVIWGDLDSFRHVNNVQYLRFLESGRIHWMRSWRREIGEACAADVLAGKGIGLILKSIDIKFKRPLLYPDTLLVAHAPHSPTPTSFGNRAAIYSYSQRKFVAESDSVLVWYDYDKLRKCEPPEKFSRIIEGRMRP